MAKRTRTTERQVWELNPTGFEAALEALGIEWKVVVRRTDARRSGNHGHCRPIFTDGEWVHNITAYKYADHEYAVKVLLHELRHAWQFERLHERNPDIHLYTAWRMWDATQGPYWTQPVEVDARKAEERYPEFMDMVVMN